MHFFIRTFIIFTFLWTSSLFASIGKVSLLKGEATVQRDAGKLALQNGAELNEKDIIFTSKDAQIQLIFVDKTVITLGSESEFKIEEYLNDATKPKAKFKFGQGAFKTITGQIGKTAPENFTLETKTATIGIRGTTVGGIVPVDPSTPETIYCLLGTISATSLLNPQAPPVIIPAGSVTFSSPTAPPSPPRPATQQELGQINQMVGTPPPPPFGNTQPPSGNTPPTSNSPSGGGDNTPPPPPPLGGSGQSFIPTAASGALQTNLQNSMQTAVFTNVARELGIPVQVLQGQIQNQTCPNGTSGIFPNCTATACPSGTTGTYPNCFVLTCPAGTSGTYPNCGTCTALQTGNYPNCVDRTCPSGTSGTYPNCTALTCPAGTTGTYPNCGTCTALQTGTYPNCVDRTCPSGTTGTYPNCTALTCPAGTSGTYPNCGTCTALQTGTYPNCVDRTCPSGTSGTYPNCEALTCPNGTTGTYPSCSPTTNLHLSGLATSSRETSSTEYTHNNALTTWITNGYATGQIDIPNGSPLSLTSTEVDITSPSLFTVAISNDGITQLSSIASPDSNVFWGKWTSSEIDNGNKLIHTENNFWVAGKTADQTTAASHTANLYGYTNQYTTYTYLGKTLGAVYNSIGQLFAIDPVNDATNEVKLKFQFGNSAAPINETESHIRFTANGYWDIGVSEQAHALANGSFGAMLSGTGSIGGSMNGYFYGANAASLGGTFKATDSNTSSTAIGAFVASKSETITTLSGLGTSVYVDSTPETRYSNGDTIAFNITDLTSVAGTISLLRDPSPAPLMIDAYLMSINTFGSNSDYLYWGKWISSEVDNKHILVASSDNFWVAGTNKVEASTYITNLRSDTRKPILTYKGNVMGSTFNSGARYAIDENLATNKVLLQFNLGETNPIDTTNSLITFVSHGDTWLLKPIGSSLSDGTFNASFNSNSSHVGNDRNVSFGSLLGNFYGPSANAAGGTFQATIDSNMTALGIFKTIKTGEFYYPATYTVNLIDNSNYVGIRSFSGLATSQYASSISIADTFTFSIDTSTYDTTTGDIVFNGRSGSVSLAKGIDANKATYINDNNFAFKDFTEAKGWLETDNTYNNDYVSWGYWAANSSDSSKLTTKTNYWVGGSQADANASILYIAGLPANTHYIYTGKVLGDVEEAGWRHTIDSATSDVQLKFNFGGGANSLYNDPSYSWIRFSANGKQWDLKPTLTTPTVTNGTFSDTLTGTVTQELAVPVTSGLIKGKFYGDQAQAVGGTFNAATATAKAIGVFKAVK